MATDRASEIARVARTIVEEEGVEALTMRRLADRLGVKAPSLYKHVNGLEGLRRELAVLGMRELAARLSKAAMGRTGHSALGAVSHAYRAFATDRPGLYAATMRAPSPDDEEHTAVSQDALDVAIAVMRSYGIELPDAVHAIRIYRSAMHGFVTQEATGAFGMPESVDESYRLMVEVLDVAFTAWKDNR